jgi:hypothetical protein
MRRSRAIAALVGAIATTLVGSTAILGGVGRQVSPAAADLTFKLQRSASTISAGCLPNASGVISVTRLARTEEMTIHVTGLYPSSVFTVFLTQVPNGPFGVSIYEGDIATDTHGAGTNTFVGRFAQAAFVVGPGTAVAPTIHTSPFADASTNPAFAPVHVLHVGLWFNSEQRSVAAGCAAVLSPFNGTHTAGPQVLSTRQFPDTAGPLGRLN